MYWMRAEGRWHHYKASRAIHSLKDALTEIRSDPYGCFFGWLTFPRFVFKKLADLAHRRRLLWWNYIKIGVSSALEQCGFDLIIGWIATTPLLSVSLFILIAAYALIAIGSFMILIEAFRESVLWGLACLFLPFVTLFFLIVHWPAAKSGFFVQLLGVLVLVVSLIFLPGSRHAYR
jgi:Protein of unknown function (DUF3024)